LHFLPSDGSNDFHSRLEMFPLDNAPKYIALSYEWGLRKSTRPSISILHKLGAIRSVHRESITGTFAASLNVTELPRAEVFLDRCAVLISRLIPNKTPRKLEVLTSVF
jgi:hypothetical protein